MLNPRPVMLGVVGDSAAGKTTITRGLVRLLGEQHVTHVATDDYHRYDRRQRAERGVTPLHPDCNYLDVMEQDLINLRAGRAILKPVYQHRDGTFGAPVYVRPRQFAVVEGLLGYHSDRLRQLYDVRVFLDPPEPLRRGWKVQRDCSRRGYTTDQVLEELDRREPDSEAFIRPQQRWADIVVSFTQPRGDADQAHLDAMITLRDALAHPDLASIVDDRERGMRFEQHGLESRLWIPGNVDPEVAGLVEEEIWSRMHFASHLRSERLGEFTVGTDLHRSHSLAIVQVLILYHLITARASVALGADGARADRAMASPSPLPPATVHQSSRTSASED